MCHTSPYTLSTRPALALRSQHSATPRLQHHIHTTTTTSRTPGRLILQPLPSISKHRHLPGCLRRARSPTALHVHRQLPALSHAARNVKLVRQVRESPCLVHIYGSFQSSFGANSTFNITTNCGSHFEEYGWPPDDKCIPREATRWFAEDFCKLVEIEQLLGRREKNATCPPEEGYAFLTGMAWFIDLFFHQPVGSNLSGASTVVVHRSLRRGTTSQSMRRRLKATGFSA